MGFSTLVKSYEPPTWFDDMYALICFLYWSLFMMHILIAFIYAYMAGILHQLEEDYLNIIDTIQKLNRTHFYVVYILIYITFCSFLLSDYVCIILTILMWGKLLYDVKMKYFTLQVEYFDKSSVQIFLKRVYIATCGIYLLVSVYVMIMSVITFMYIWIKGYENENILLNIMIYIRDFYKSYRQKGEEYIGEFTTIETE